MQASTRRRPETGTGMPRQTSRRWHGVLSVIGMLVLAGTAAAFDASCGTLPAWSAATVTPFSAVVPIRASGRASGVTETWQSGKMQRRLASSDFTLIGRGVVVGQFVVTAAHVVYPEKVALALDQYTTTVSSVVAVQQTTVTIGTMTDVGGMPADIVHLNHQADLAILRPANPALLHALPYAAVDTWWRESPGEANSLLSAENCVIALVPARDAHHVPLLATETRSGHVIAPHAVSSSAIVVASLNPETVTISTPMSPGDSGSPVIAFDRGEPRLVGIVSATRHPREATTYISRIDTLLPILAALQASSDAGAQLAQAR